MEATPFCWPQGQKCAISLSYDDALPVHYEYVGPSLTAAGLRATFNMLINSDPLQNPDRWRRFAASGHELGNHTLFHPCQRTVGREWVDPEYDLCTYTPKRLRTELQIANLILYLLDGKQERTYANTCCDTSFGCGEQGTSMDSLLAELFLAARGPCNGKVADVKNGINLMQVGSFGADSCFLDFKGIQTIVEEAAAIGGWAVFLIHGVGKGTHDMYMETSIHEQLVAWLAAHRADVWTAPFIDVARHVKEYAFYCNG
ncbi:MAG: polysaccharide deacetylase family protein [Chloroflexota bacterium]